MKNRMLCGVALGMFACALVGSQVAARPASGGSSLAAWPPPQGPAQGQDGPQTMGVRNPLEPVMDTFTCPDEVAPDQFVWPAPLGGGGGMTGDGWDGSGQNSTTIFWHQENTTSDLGAGQRAALIDGMSRWAGVVQITFREVILPNRNRSVDWAWATGDHSALEPAESGDADCPFVASTLAHAGFPPGVNSQCSGSMSETFAGNVHFNDASNWELDSEGPAGAISAALIAAHEVGHSIGLTHSGASDIMRPGFSNADVAQAPTANDMANIRSGYATGTGSVRTVEQDGIWVDGGFDGTQMGTQVNPVTSVWTAVDNFPPFAGFTVVHIAPGTYEEPGGRTITDSMELRAESGVVTIR